MSTAYEAVTIPMPQPSLSTFERYLTVWVFLCIIIGVALEHWFPRPFEVLGQLKIAEVNLPVAVLIWLMIIPMLLKIDFAALHQVKEHWRGRCHALRQLGLESQTWRARFLSCAPPPGATSF